MGDTEPTSEAKKRFDAYFENCPSRQVLSRISDKWVVLTLTVLGGGPLRYSQLSQRLAGVSQKMLTQTLRALERDGLVTRTVTPSVPPRVDYALTPLGESLRERIAPLKSWAEDNMDEIQLARDAYDAAESTGSTGGVTDGPTLSRGA